MGIHHTITQLRTSYDQLKPSSRTGKEIQHDQNNRRAVVRHPISIAPLAANAALETYVASGTIDWLPIEGVSRMPAPLTSPVLGERVTLEWTVDTSTPSFGGNNYSWSRYYPNAMTALSLQTEAGSLAFDLSTTQQAYIGIDNNYLGNPFSETWETGYELSWSSNSYALFMGSTATSQSHLNLYSNADLTNSPLDPTAANDQNKIVFYDRLTATAQVTVSIDSMTPHNITPTPLPSSAWLLCTALAAWSFLLAWRKKAHTSRIGNRSI